MNDIEFREAVKKNELVGGYLLFGDEDFLKHRYALDMCAAVCAADPFDLNRIRLDGDDCSPELLCEAITSFPVMAERKAVLLSRFAADSLPEREFSSYIEVFSHVRDNPQTVLAVEAPADALDAGNLPRRPSARYKKLASVLCPVEFATKSAAVLKKWIAKQLFAVGVEAMPDALDRVLELCGTDMNTLHGECEKLSAFALANGVSVDVRTVDYVCSESGGDDAFALANAVLAGDRGAALAALDSYKEKREEPVAVCAALGRVLCDMLNVCAMQSEGASRADIAAALKMHEYKCGLYMKALAGMEPARLRAAVERCADADRLLKSSDLRYIALERLICTIPATAARRSLS